MPTTTSRDPRAVASGVRITKALQLAGMKKVHLAEALRRKLDCEYEYARHCVKRWTNGKHRPRRETMEVIAEVLAEHAAQPTEVFRAALGIDEDEEDEAEIAEQRKLFRQRLLTTADELFDEVVQMRHEQQRRIRDRELVKT